MKLKKVNVLHSKNDPQKIIVRVMPDKGRGHRFMTIVRTKKNAKGRYVETTDQFFKVGLLWPTPGWQTRSDLALLVGKAILDEIGV
jgi:hypothetical protein